VLGRHEDKNLRAERPPSGGNKRKCSKEDRTFCVITKIRKAGGERVFRNACKTAVARIGIQEGLSERKTLEASKSGSVVGSGTTGRSFLAYFGKPRQT